MTEPGSTIPPDEVAQLQKKFSEIKHCSTVLAEAPQIVTSLQEFAQVLNEKVGQK